MNKEKAKRHLKSAYESLNLWRREYVYACRNEVAGWTKEQCIKDINVCKERISWLQRYAY